MIANCAISSDAIVNDVMRIVAWLPRPDAGDPREPDGSRRRSLRWLLAAHLGAGRASPRTEGRTVYAVDDVHGRYDLLMALLDAIVEDLRGLSGRDLPCSSCLATMSIAARDRPTCSPPSIGLRRRIASSCTCSRETTRRRCPPISKNRRPRSAGCASAAMRRCAPTASSRPIPLLRPRIIARPATGCATGSPHRIFACSSG